MPALTPQEVRQLPITLTLGTLNHILFDEDGCSLESTFIPRQLAGELQQIDIHSQLFFVDKDNPQNNEFYVCVWKSLSWRSSAERILKERARAASERLLYNLRDEAVAKMLPAIREMQAFSDIDAAKQLGYLMLKRKMRDGCRTFGLDSESEEWKPLFD